MVKAWFNKLGFQIVADIEYTNNGRPIKPYLSSFIVRLNVQYDGKDEEIGIRVFPPSDKILVEYKNKDEYVDAKSPIEYTGIPNFSSIGKALDHMDIPGYVKRVLKIIADNTYFYDNPLKILSPIKTIQVETTQDEIQDLSNTPDDLSGVTDLPRVTQTVKMYGTIFDENPYGESLGRVYIDEYFTINDETEYEVSHNSFKVEQLLQSGHGELIAIADRRKEEFNPSSQEILEVIIPTQQEFENLVRFVKDAIKKGKVEFAIKKGKVEFGVKNTY
jgi:hypothetical protein